MNQNAHSDVFFCIVSLQRFLSFINRTAGINYASVPEFVKYLESQGGRWPRLEGADAMDDAAIYQRLAALHEPAGRVLMVSEVSYRRGSGAFEMDARQLPHFVVTHRGLFKEVLFNGDVLILDAEKGVVVVFHHEGVYARFALNHNS